MPRAFEFRLEALRTVRRRRRDARRRVVADLLRNLAECAQQMASLRGRVSETQEQMRRVAGQRGTAPVNVDMALDLTAIRFGHLYLNRLQRLLSDAAKDRARMEAKLKEAQGELAEATKQVKVLDKLEQRQRQRFELELSRRERAEQDELATQRFAARWILDTAVAQPGEHSR